MTLIVLTARPLRRGGRYGEAVDSPGAAERVAAQKTALRDQLLTARRRLSLLELRADAEAIAGHLLAAPEVRRAATVAAYVAVGSEPGTGPLLEALSRAGRRVILPVLLPDGDLDWAAWTGGAADLEPARLGLLEPTGPRLGREAVATADVVVVPGVAVDPSGMRMGRGGGSYDRALGRVPVGTFTCVLLHDGEIVDRVPADTHDRPVTAAATPAGLTRFGPAPA
jgi:5-formyltetrahydrofolate cyclo-ligase